MSETLVQTTDSKITFDINILYLDCVVRQGANLSLQATPKHIKMSWFGSPAGFSSIRPDTMGKFSRSPGPRKARRETGRQYDQSTL